MKHYKRVPIELIEEQDMKRGMVVFTPDFGRHGCLCVVAANLAGDKPPGDDNLWVDLEDGEVLHYLDGTNLYEWWDMTPLFERVVKDTIRGALDVAEGSDK